VCHCIRDALAHPSCSALRNEFQFDFVDHHLIKDPCLPAVGSRHALPTIVFCWISINSDLSIQGAVRGLSSVVDAPAVKDIEPEAGGLIWECTKHPLARPLGRLGLEVKKVRLVSLQGKLIFDQKVNQVVRSAFAGILDQLPVSFPPFSGGHPVELRGLIFSLNATQAGTFSSFAQISDSSWNLGNEDICNIMLIIRIGLNIN
jgi:hypothetical protein